MDNNPHLAGGPPDSLRRSNTSHASAWQGPSCFDPFARHTPYRPDCEDITSDSEGHDSRVEFSLHSENILDFYDAVTN